MEYLDKIFLGDGIACINTGRHYTGFEKDERYYRVAQNRIAERLKQSST